MEQKPKKGKLKGSVLITVVTVMSVLVVFLMSTLILTTASHRRAFYTYYQTQAQYAAQAALDAVTNYAYSDQQFSQWVAGISDDLEHEFYVEFQDASMQLSQGELPDTSVYSATGLPESSVLCTVQREKPNYVWDDVTQAVHETRAWKITATAYVGTGRNQSSYTMVNYIYANVKTGDVGSSTNDLTYTKHTYTYQEGESHVNIDPTGSYTPVANAVYSLAPSGTGDNFMVLGPQYSGMTELPVGRIKYDSASTQSMANDSAVVGNAIYVNNLSVAVTNNFNFQDKGEGAQFWGNLTMVNDGNCFDALINPELAAQAWDYTELNYVYVDGTLKTHKSGIGYRNYNSRTKSDMPVNLFAGAVHIDADDYGAIVQGDVYLYDPELYSEWSFPAQSTLITTFVSNNVARQNASYMTSTGGSIVCNNYALYLGTENANPLTIDGDFIYTNPDGYIYINACNITVNGRIICACPADHVVITQNNGKGSLTSAVGAYSYGSDADAYTGTDYGPQTLAQYRTNLNGLTYNVNAEVIVPAETTDPVVMTDADLSAMGINAWSYDTSRYSISYIGWDGTLNANTFSFSEILTPATTTTQPVAYSCDFSLIPFNYRLDEIMSKYYRWDLADVTDWMNDPFVKESMACGHGWQTTTFNGVTVPYTMPVYSSNVIINSFEPIETTNAIATVSKQTNMNFYEFDTFKTNLSGKESYNATNKPKQATVDIVTAQDSDTDPYYTIQQNVYYINDSCEIDLNAFTSGDIIFIDPSTAASQPLYVALKGTLGGVYVMTNNTAQYTATTLNGNLNVTLNGIYGVDDGVNDYSNVYAQRNEVYFFLENGFGFNSIGASERKVYGIITSGLYDAIGINSTLDLVSNPLYPDAGAAYDNLSNSEKFKFMLVPNDIIFGEKDATFSIPNGGRLVGDVMMPYSYLSHSTQQGKVQVDYREYHDSSVYSTDSNHPLITVGSLVIKSFTGQNWPMVAYIGDGNRGATISEEEDPGIIDDPTFGSHDQSPNANDGQDYFSNDHQGQS